jgi:hypothetical protein
VAVAVVTQIMAHTMAVVVVLVDFVQLSPQLAVEEQ